MPGVWFGASSYPAVTAAHPPDLPRARPLESRMLGNLHVRFGGGRTEKEPKGHLAGRLPYASFRPAGAPDRPEDLAQPIMDQ